MDFRPVVDRYLAGPVTVLHGVQFGHPFLHGGVDAQVEFFDLLRAGYFFPDKLVDGPTVDYADQFTDHPTEVPWMIGDHPARFVVQGYLFHGFHRRFPVVPPVPGHVARGVGEPRFVGQHVPDSDLFLAVLGECGPVGGDRVVPAQFAPLPKDVETGGGHRFGGGVKDKQCVFSYRSARLLVSQAAVQVNDRHPVPVDRQRRARVDSSFDLLIE